MTTLSAVGIISKFEEINHDLSLLERDLADPKISSEENEKKYKSIAKRFEEFDFSNVQGVDKTLKLGFYQVSSRVLNQIMPLHLASLKKVDEDLQKGILNPQDATQKKNKILAQINGLMIGVDKKTQDQFGTQMMPIVSQVSRTIQLRNRIENIKVKQNEAYAILNIREDIELYERMTNKREDLIDSAPARIAECSTTLDNYLKNPLSQQDIGKIKSLKVELSALSKKVNDLKAGKARGAVLPVKIEGFQKSIIQTGPAPIPKPTLTVFKPSSTSAAVQPQQVKVGARTIFGVKMVPVPKQ